MKKLKKIKSNLLDEIERLRREAEFLEIGSEEYLNNCKAQNQLAECVKKLEILDANTLIPGCISVVMFIIYMILQQTRIVDLRPIQAIKGLFKR